jgi:catechol 2,3-dioxygenase-like lactoylglutathione lyase family enzyme
MSHKGFSHIGLSTLDLDRTRQFYEGVLGFKPVISDTIKIKEGGRIRHIFFHTGRDQLIAFYGTARSSRRAGRITMQVSTADSGFRPPSIILLSRPARRLPWPRNATSYAPRVWRSLISSITHGPSRSISKIPMVCRSSIAACCAI